MTHKLVIFIISLPFLFSCNGHKDGETAANLARQLSIQKNKLDMVEVETIDAAFKAFQYKLVDHFMNFTETIVYKNEQELRLRLKLTDVSLHRKFNDFIF